MIKLVKHLWDQLLNDEEAAKIRLSAAKTAALALGGHVLLVTGGDVSKAFSWGKGQWAAAILTALIAGGAKASDPVTPKAQP